MADVEQASVAQLLVRAEQVVQGLAGELERMRVAAEVLAESGERADALVVGVSNLVAQMDDLIQVVKVVDADLRGPDLSGRVERLETAVHELVVGVNAAVDDGWERALGELNRLNREMAVINERLDALSRRKGFLL